MLSLNAFFNIEKINITEPELDFTLTTINVPSSGALVVFRGSFELFKLEGTHTFKYKRCINESRHQTFKGKVEKYVACTGFQILTYVQTSVVRGIFYESDV